jgi:hypothetical protein
MLSCWHSGPQASHSCCGATSEGMTGSVENYEIKCQRLYVRGASCTPLCWRGAQSQHGADVDAAAQHLRGSSVACTVTKSGTGWCLAIGARRGAVAGACCCCENKPNKQCH